mgnify:CR=1 FL=1
MSEDSDDLEELYVSQDDINRRRILEALQGVIGIDKDSGDMVPLQGFKNLPGRKKFVAYLLYRRAANILGEIQDEKLGAGSKEIAEVANVGASTVRKYASDLDFVDKDTKNGGYFIPSAYIPNACDAIPEKL